MPHLQAVDMHKQQDKLNSRINNSLIVTCNAFILKNKSLYTGYELLFVCHSLYVMLYMWFIRCTQ